LLERALAGEEIRAMYSSMSGSIVSISGE